MGTIGSTPVSIGIFHGNRVSIDRLFPGGIVPPVYGYCMTQAAYDLITPEANLYYAIISTATGETISAAMELTAAQYEDMTSHGTDVLFIITDGSTISDVYVGDTECDRLYHGSTELWTKQSLPILPRRMKLAYDIAKRYWDRNYSPFKAKAIALSDNGIDAISSTHYVYVWVSTEDTKEITYNSQSSSERTANIGGIQARYKKDDGWTTPTMYSIQNMSIYFPTYQYTNNMLVPASGFTLTYQGNTLSQEYDFDTLEPVPLPSYFPNVNLDDIVATYYTPSYYYFIDIMGIVDDNTVGFIRAYWDGEDEASLGCTGFETVDGNIKYSGFYTTYYHTTSAKHQEFCFTLNKTTGAVLYHTQISAGSGRHYFTEFKFNRDEPIQIYTNNSCYPELNSTIQGYVTVR